MELDSLDKKLLTKIQFDFPLTLTPYARLAEMVGATEADVIARLGRLRESNVIRQISAIFDTRNLGYTSALVAMKIPAEKLSAGARVVNDFPGVSHNYKREADYNLWFTIAVPPGHDLNETVKTVAVEAGADSTLILPTLKLYKIGVKLDVTGQSNGLEQDAPQEFKRVRRTLSDRERALVRALQKDLELISHPFEPVAREVGIREEEVFEIIRRFTDEGIMRRYAAVLYHRKAGFAFNGMGVWKVPDDRIQELGVLMGSFRGVSHCYHRPTYPEWPYALYTMVHGMKEEDCEKIIEGISQATGIKEYRILYSTVEYKKDRIDYFSNIFDDWYQHHRLPAGAAPHLRTVASYADIY